MIIDASKRRRKETSHASRTAREIRTKKERTQILVFAVEKGKKKTGTKSLSFVVGRTRVRMMSMRRKNGVLLCSSSFGACGEEGMRSPFDAIQPPIRHSGVGPIDTRHSMLKVKVAPLYARHMQRAKKDVC